MGTGGAYSIRLFVIGLAFAAGSFAACSSSSSDGGAPADAGTEAKAPPAPPPPAPPENPASCDTIKQDCAVAPDTRCTIVKGATYGPACVATTGTKAIGDLCTVDLVNGDDCVKGAFCTYDGFGQKAPRCAKLCHTASDCASGEACANIQYPSSRANFKDGVCSKTCTPSFDTSSCASGEDCTFVVETTAKTLAFLCRPSGSGTQGTTCSLHDDCVAKAVCNPLHVCALVCNAAHPCDGSDGGVDAGDAGADAGGLHCSDFGTADYGYCE